MFKVRLNSKATIWLNPDHIASLQDEGGFVTIRMADGIIHYAHGETAQSVANIINGSNI